MSIDSLRGSLADAIAESRALRVDVHAAEQARRKSSRISLIVISFLSGLVVLLIGITVQNNSLARRVDDTNRRMADCTNPGGACYQQGAIRTGQAISDVIRSEIFMAECARLYPGESGPAYDKKLEACVAERLAGPALRSGTQASPSPSRKG